MVYNLACRILGDPGQAAAATENTFLRAFRSLPRGRCRAHRLWLIQIAVAACQEQMFQAQNQSFDSGEPSLGTNGQEVSTKPAVSSCDGSQAFLNALPPEQRVTLVLADVQGLSKREIADITGVSVDVIQSRLSQGHVTLRNTLFAEGKLSPEMQL